MDPAAISLYRYGDSLPPEHWAELDRRDPAAICRQALVDYEKGDGYGITFLGERYQCDPIRRKIFKSQSPLERLGFQDALVLLVYLLHARELPLSGKWVTEKELPGGALFFRGPHALAREPLEKRYARNPQGLLEAGQTLGGRATGKGDGSFVLTALPRVRLEYIFYGEDEEFPAQLIITFDRTVEQHLPLDVIWALVNITGKKLLEAGEALAEKH
ncbi:MAG: DUF3786 domain-containing protein [Deltaproteobacteria bacterium]|nr:DUF3786 domain-containing protein [Deltaproteobacteria bacterium]